MRTFEEESSCAKKEDSLVVEFYAETYLNAPQKSGDSTMSATIKTNAAEGGALAHLNFRVRCETLGHGDGIFLVRSDDPHLTRVSFPNSRIMCLCACPAAAIKAEDIVSVGEVLL